MRSSKKSLDVEFFSAREYIVFLKGNRDHNPQQRFRFYDSLNKNTLTSCGERCKPVLLMIGSSQLRYIEDRRISTNIRFIRMT